MLKKLFTVSAMGLVLLGCSGAITALCDLLNMPSDFLVYLGYVLIALTIIGGIWLEHRLFTKVLWPTWSEDIKTFFDNL